MTTDRDIRLVPLDDLEYAEFAQQQVDESARQRVNAGEWTPEEAPGRARQEQAALLADGLRGAGHDFLKGIAADGTHLGWLWVGPMPAFFIEDRDRKRWLCQITVEPSLRGRGYGRALLAALHRWLEAQGTEELWLRVYDWNEPARRLYARAGYEVVRQFATDAHLRRRLAS